MQDKLLAQINRRSMLGLGGTLAAGLLAVPKLQADHGHHGDSDGDGDADDQPSQQAKATAKNVEAIIGAQGMFSNGVFSIEIDRNDINNVTLHGVPILPSFQINGTLVFEFVDNGGALMNSDMALKASEIDPFIDKLLKNNIVFQAEHQHFYDFDPLVWFIHFRQYGEALKIAQGIKDALNVTSTPFPQTMPSNPTTPLPADKIGKILGATPQIGANGVVNLQIPRANPMYLGGVRINPYLNVETPIAFEPYGGGDNAAGVIDFGMVASEVQRVMNVMRPLGWDVGCLYNQETDEHPQLYFSHQFKTGNAIDLAMQMRAGLDQMDVKFK